jgi:hypothetical protein
MAAARTEDDGGVAYLRPETAQGVYVQFGNVCTAMRARLPFGACACVHRDVLPTQHALYLAAMPEASCYLRIACRRGLQRIA